MAKTFTTSGSTGRPKKFTVSDELLRARAMSRGVNKGPIFAACNSILCALNPDSTAGASYELWAKMNGKEFYCYRHISDIRRFLDEVKPEALIADTMTLMAFTLIGSNHRFNCVLETGSPTSAAQSRVIRASLGEYFIASYGASEVGTIALATAEMLETAPGCVGDIVPGAAVSIRDGVIWARTPYMIDGYDDPALTEVTFRDGWFCTGDRGRFEDGLLVVEGRV